MSDTPSFEFMDDFSLDSLREELGDVVIPEGPIEPAPPVVKRGRGRPRKNPLPIPVTESVETDPRIFAPAPLTKRDEKDVAIRLEQILTGATGIPSMMLDKEYLRMTDEEANGIAVPLASYLSRNVETIPMARQIIENYDLAGVILGIMMYTMRLYRDRRIEVATNIAAAQSASRRSVGQRTAPVEEGPEVREDGRSFVPGVGSYGISSPI